MVWQSVRREVVQRDGKIERVAQWIDREVMGFGRYAFCPKGPVALGGMKGFGGNDCMFLRVEPESAFLLEGARKTIDVNPAHTLITDLSKSEEELLAAMHPKTRYNISVARRHGVEVDVEARDLDAVWSLFSQTATRDAFRLHPRFYYQTMLEALRGSGLSARSPIGFLTGKALATAIVLDFGDTRTYLHGASSSQDRNAMAPYLLHWELMRDAKARGLRYYDWWGVAPEHVPNHSWAGISRFKRGFGGDEVSTPGTYDIVLKPVSYRMYHAIRSLVRFTRRLGHS